MHLRAELAGRVVGLLDRVGHVVLVAGHVDLADARARVGHYRAARLRDDLVVAQLLGVGPDRGGRCDPELRVSGNLPSVQQVGHFDDFGERRVGASEHDYIHVRRGTRVETGIDRLLFLVSEGVAASRPASLERGLFGRRFGRDPGDVEHADPAFGRERRAEPLRVFEGGHIASAEDRHTQPRQVAPEKSERSPVGEIFEIGLDVDQNRAAPIFGDVEAEARDETGERGGHGGLGPLAVGAGAQDAVGIRYRRRLHPCARLPLERGVADYLGRAGPGELDTGLGRNRHQRRLHLEPFLIDPELAPFFEIDEADVRGRRRFDPQLTEHFQSLDDLLGFAFHGDREHRVNVVDGDQPVGRHGLAVLDEIIHRHGDNRAAAAFEHLFLAVREFHPDLPASIFMKVFVRTAVSLCRRQHQLDCFAVISLEKDHREVAQIRGLGIELYARLLELGADVVEFVHDERDVHVADVALPALQLLALRMVELEQLDAAVVQFHHRDPFFNARQSDDHAEVGDVLDREIPFELHAEDVAVEAD